MKVRVRSRRMGRCWGIVSYLATSTTMLFGQAQDDAPCAAALRQGTVCEAANQHALDIMRRDHLLATTVIQDVQTGSVIAFAASDPAKLDVTSPLLPLSTVKLILAASWWDHGQPDVLTSDSSRLSVSEMIVNGSDIDGRRIATALRKTVGTEGVLKDLGRYGFCSRSSAASAGTFLAAVSSPWKERLVPATANHSLSTETSAQDWADTLSIGEARLTTTALNLSRFLQAVGNGGVLLSARAVAAEDANTRFSSDNDSVRIMKEATAIKLQAAMRAVVERGTARGVADVLRGTGWQIGGKTGTGPGPQQPGPQSDGWFAGLIFDPQGKARFSVATFVRHGGYGGGNAARISAELARFLSGTSSELSSIASSGISPMQRFAQMEERFGGRISIAAVDASKEVSYRAEERFPMCSIFKVLAVAAVLKNADEQKEKLDRSVSYGEAQLLAYAPVTRAHVKEGGMKLDDLCAAAIKQSDNTAGNLVLDAIGGPAGLTRFARSIGDKFTRLERLEPELNNAVPGEERDSTTAAAICQDLQRLLVGDVLTQASRQRLENWMQHCETGTAMIRASVPGEWLVGDKTGRSTIGATNDIAILRRPEHGPLFLSILTYAPDKSTEARDQGVAELARVVIETLRQ